MVAAGEEARHGGAEARRRREFWGEREPVLTISLKELPVGFKRTDRLSLRIPQLRGAAFGRGPICARDRPGRDADEVGAGDADGEDADAVGW